MPQTVVCIFQESEDLCAFLDWMGQLPRKVQAKCINRIARLEALGHELRRPEADILRDGIYELRISYQRVNYRILYFFCDQQIVISNGLTKEKEVPNTDIDHAIGNRKKFMADSIKHTKREP